MKRAIAVALVLFSLGKSVNAEIKFEKKKLQVGGQILTVEVADDNEKRMHGLMFRTKLADTEGMIFIFEREQILNFWMKDTLIPLDIGYFDKEKTLIDIQTMTPASSVELKPKTYPSQGPAQFALEVPEGWFAKHKVKAGAKFKFFQPVTAKSRE